MVGTAIKVAKIATGEIEEDIDDDGKNKSAVELGRKGGKARARSLSERERKALARKAANARWKKVRSAPAKKERT